MRRLLRIRFAIAAVVVAAGLGVGVSHILAARAVTFHNACSGHTGWVSNDGGHYYAPKGCQ